MQRRQPSGTRIGGGGKDTSYYIRIDNGVAFKLTQRKYKKMFSNIFTDCESVEKKYKKRSSWSKFEKAVFDYNQNCKN